MRDPHSVFSKALPCPKNWPRVRGAQHARHGAARSRRRVRLAAFSSGGEKASIRAHIGAEVTSAAGWRYPLLVESREGYQNLCRLITRMKLRARKGEGSVQPEEIAAMGGGLICLTGGDEGPLAHALSQGGMDAAIECVQQLCRAFGRRKCLRRIAAPSFAAKKKRAIRPPWTSREN